MMSGCFSPPGGGDPWAHDYEDDRLYRMSARKFNKHMAEKRRRYRINTALERLKYIILHVMSRNPEHFDKMEKADILDLTVKFLKAVQKKEGLPGCRPPPAHSHHRTSGLQGAPRSSATTSNIRVYQDAEQTPSHHVTASSSSAPRHQGKERVFPGLKSRSGNIPSAVVRATPQDYDVTSVYSSFKRPESVPSCSPTKRPTSSSSATSAPDGVPALKKFKPASTSSASAGSSRDLGSDAEKAGKQTTFGLNLEYRVHSAFRIHHRDAGLLSPPELLHPVLKRPPPGLPPHAASVRATSGSTSASANTPELAKPGTLTIEIADQAPATKSKTSELKIEIPEVDVRMAVPPLQPVAHDASPPLVMPLPLPMAPSQGMWRPW